MRKFIVAGNWKMNTTVPEGEKLAEQIQSNVGFYDTEKFQLIVAPPFTHLYPIAQIIDNDYVKLGAQNLAWEEKGAFTGEIAAPMLQSIEVQYVIIGHSERRKYFKEDDSLLLKKIYLALKYNLKPIFCVGELLEQREANQHFNIVEKQIKNVLFNLAPEQIQNIIIAYEPVWAIGTGKVASPEQAQEMHKFIRSLFAQKYSEQIAQDLTILYGGSCKPSNAQGLFAQPDIDGGLIGGASLKAQDFLEIFKILKQQKQ
jgi:triosephosphate isomerase